MRTVDEQGLPEISVTRLPENSGRIDLEQLTKYFASYWRGVNALSDSETLSWDPDYITYVALELMSE